MQKIVRVIRYYNKKNDQLAGEIELPPISFSELQSEFDMPPDNPMYDCYVVEEKQTLFLMKFKQFDFDNLHYEYFLEHPGRD